MRIADNPLSPASGIFTNILGIFTPLLCFVNLTGGTILTETILRDDGSQLTQNVTGEEVRSEGKGYR